MKVRQMRLSRCKKLLEQCQQRGASSSACGSYASSNVQYLTPPGIRHTTSPAHDQSYDQSCDSSCSFSQPAAHQSTLHYESHHELYSSFAKRASKYYHPRVASNTPAHSTTCTRAQGVPTCSTRTFASSARPLTRTPDDLAASSSSTSPFSRLKMLDQESDSSWQQERGSNADSFDVVQMAALQQGEASKSHIPWEDQLAKVNTVGQWCAVYLRNQSSLTPHQAVQLLCQLQAINKRPLKFYNKLDSAVQTYTRKLVQFIMPHDADISNQDLVHLANFAGSIRYGPDPDFYDALITLLSQRVPELHVSDLARALPTIPHIRERFGLNFCAPQVAPLIPRLFHQASLSVRRAVINSNTNDVRVVLHNPAKDLALILWSFSRLKYADSDMFTAIADYFTIQKPRYTPINVSMAAYAFARTKQFHSDLFQDFSQYARESITFFNGQDLSNLAWAFAILDVNDTALFRCIQRHMSNRMDSHSPQAVCSVVWSLARANLAPADVSDVCARLSANSAYLFKEYSLQDCGHILYAMSALRFFEMHMYNVLTDYVCEHLSATERAPLHVLATVHQSVVNVSYYSQRLEQQIVRQILNNKEFLSQSQCALSVLAWSTSLSDHLTRNPALFSAFQTALQRTNVHEFHPSSLCRLYQAQSYLNASAPDHPQLLPAHMYEVASKQMLDSTKVVRTPIIQKHIHAKLLRAGLGAKVLLEYQAPNCHNLCVDIAVLPTNGAKIAVEVDSAVHFTWNNKHPHSVRPAGSTVTRDKLLKAAGWCVVSTGGMSYEEVTKKAGMERIIVAVKQAIVDWDLECARDEQGRRRRVVVEPESEVV